MSFLGILGSIGKAVGSLSPLGSLLGGIGSTALNQRNFNKSIQVQQAENQKNRDFNAEQAELARQYNSRMVDEQRAYDDPSEQVKRMTAAGVHPALAFGNGLQPMDMGIGSTSMGANMSAGVSSVLPDTSGLSRGFSDSAKTVESLSGAAQKNALTQLTDKQTKYYDDFMQANIANIGAQTVLYGNQSDLTIQQKATLVAQADVFDEQAQLLKQQYVNAMAQGQLFGYELDFQKAIADMRVSRFASELGISVSQAESAAKYFAAAAELEVLLAVESSKRSSEIDARVKFLQGELKEQEKYLSDVMPFKYDAESQSYQWDANNIRTLKTMGFYGQIIDKLLQVGSAFIGTKKHVYHH